jgi:hypothetical protein
MTHEVRVILKLLCESANAFGPACSVHQSLQAVLVHCRQEGRSTSNGGKIEHLSIGPIAVSVVCLDRIAIRRIAPLPLPWPLQQITCVAAVCSCSQNERTQYHDAQQNWCFHCQLTLCWWRAAVYINIEVAGICCSTNKYIKIHYVDVIFINAAACRVSVVELQKGSPTRDEPLVLLLVTAYPCGSRQVA